MAKGKRMLKSVIVSLGRNFTSNMTLLKVVLLLSLLLSITGNLHIGFLIIEKKFVKQMMVNSDIHKISMNYRLLNWRS